MLTAEQTAAAGNCSRASPAGWNSDVRSAPPQLTVITADLVGKIDRRAARISFAYQHENSLRKVPVTRLGHCAGLVIGVVSCNTSILLICGGWTLNGCEALLVRILAFGTGGSEAFLLSIRFYDAASSLSKSLQNVLAANRFCAITYNWLHENMDHSSFTL